MQFIDKFNNLRRYIALTRNQQILSNWWKTHRNSFSNLSYDNAKIDILNSHLGDSIFQDQEFNGVCRCCYCMRKIYATATKDDDNVEHHFNRTWEHVIPLNPENNSDIPKYQNYSTLDSTHIDIMIGGNINNASHFINREPYPHFIAYNNIVASCDGQVINFSKNNDSCSNQQICNNKRQNHFVDPIFFDENKCKSISYDNQGSIDDTSFDIKKAKLNNPCLKRIREFWFKIANSSYTSEDIRKAVSNQELRDMIHTDILDPEGERYTWIGDKSWIWLILSEYDWFYYYYTEKKKGVRP